MKRFAWVLPLIFLFGCATIELPDGSKYSRIGNQELIDVKIHQIKEPNRVETKASLGQQKADPEIVEALEEIRKIVQEIMERIP